MPDSDPDLEERSDPLERGLAWLAGQMQAHAGQAVIYQRGSRKVALCATLGRKLLQSSDGHAGIRMEWTDMDFLIPAADLRIGGEMVLPERGDRIKLRRSGQVYEVMAPGNEPPWRWSGPYRQTLRIHTKLVEEP